jgi:Tfp pilus assembly protein PilN
MYLVLLMIVMMTLGGSFMIIKIRQRTCNAKERLVNTRLDRIQADIQQFEQLQMKRKAMMKTALTTTELLEPVPRSVLLASFTNNLPPGVSLLRLNLIQKESSRDSGAATSKYRAAQARKATTQSNVPPEKLLETHIDIGGVAPSDLQVAAYIERLSNSMLLDNVALVESKEHKTEDGTFRQFKLEAKLRKNAHLSKKDIDRIRVKVKNPIWNF